jgi:hypothetical protein
VFHELDGDMSLRFLARFDSMAATGLGLAGRGAVDRHGDVRGQRREQTGRGRPTPTTTQPCPPTPATGFLPSCNQPDTTRSPMSPVPHRRDVPPAPRVPVENPFLQAHSAMWRQNPSRRGRDLTPASREVGLMQKYVYEFTEGGKDEKDLLGGKGANLAEMTRLGLPVPPGFTVTTEACRRYLADGVVPPELRVQVTRALRALEDTVGRQLGDPKDPLLVSVRSGAKFSMPGMMETVLNIGINDVSVRGLAAMFGDERFAWDSYRRLIAMFGKTVPRHRQPA